MKAIGLARLGRDGELRKLNSGESVVNLALAYNYGKKGDDGKRPSQWIEAAFWGTRAEKFNPYLLKGQQFLVEVRDIHTETYTKGDGGQGFKLVGTVDNIEFAGPPPGQNGSSNQNGQRQAPQQAPQRQQEPQRNDGYGNGNQQRQEAPRQAQSAARGFNDMDDDIPF